MAQLPLIHYKELNMKYFEKLSETIGTDIYVCTKGYVYTNSREGMNQIGNINTDTIYELMDNI